jgi:hypothetical protein
MHASLFLTPFVRATDAHWHRWLLRSIRLYLALDEPLVDAQQVQDALRLVEWQLVRHLVSEPVPTPTATEQAREIVAMAQANFLSCDCDVVLLCEQMSAEQALHPWRRAA